MCTIMPHSLNLKSKWLWIKESKNPEADYYLHTILMLVPVCATLSENKNSIMTGNAKETGRLSLRWISYSPGKKVDPEVFLKGSVHPWRNYGITMINSSIHKQWQEEIDRQPIVKFSMEIMERKSQSWKWKRYKLSIFGKKSIFKEG